MTRSANGTMTTRENTTRLPSWEYDAFFAGHDPFLPKTDPRVSSKSRTRGIGSMGRAAPPCGPATTAPMYLVSHRGNHCDYLRV